MGSTIMRCRVRRSQPRAAASRRLHRRRYDGTEKIAILDRSEQLSDDQFMLGPGATSDDEHNDLSPRAYEHAVAERFRTFFPRPAFEVRHDIRLPGRASAVRWQVDTALYEANGSVPILLVEVTRTTSAVTLMTSGEGTGLRKGKEWAGSSKLH